MSNFQFASIQGTLTTAKYIFFVISKKKKNTYFLYREETQVVEIMGRNSSQFLIAFVVFMMMAIAAYIKIWTVDYQISSQEAQLLRQQFDLAHREAMDESAEWRQRFDVEVEKTKTCIKELDEIKESHQIVTAAGINRKLEMLEKENMDLLDRIEIMKQELEAERLKCGMQQV